MKFTFDENPGERSAETLRQAGFDVATVAAQGMQGAPDVALAAACRDAGRCLVTMDVEFANPLLYRPPNFGGIVVLRPPGRCNRQVIDVLVSTLRDALVSDESDEAARRPLPGPTGRLWIVEPGRVRLYQGDDA